jgi:uncharacterized membrane protein
VGATSTEDNTVIPSPLHPAVVHFPIVLMVFLPLIVAGVLWAIRRGAKPRAWALVAITAGLLAASAFVAIRTGEAQEEKVEPVVSEQALHQHEEAADAFMLGAAVVLGLALVGFMRGNFGRAARLATLVGSLALVWLGWRVGDQGGKLVYQYGAGSAYSTTTQGGDVAPGGDDER